MAVQGGYGLTIQIGGTAVANVIDIGIPKTSVVMAEATAHDSPSGYYEAVPSGKRRLEVINAKLAWDQANTSHATDILGALASNASFLWSIADPAGNETIEFAAHIESLERIATQEGILEADLSIHPTGTATIT